MQVYRDPVTFYLVVLPYTRALDPVGRKGKIESTEDQGPLGTRPESDTHHFLSSSIGGTGHMATHRCKGFWELQSLIWYSVPLNNTL